jgi:AcrR family transcriptional regulator
MARRIPTDRLAKLLDAAAETFIANGFHRTQMDDVAERLGVSKGTIYRSVESKEALLGAVLDYADTPESLPDGGSIPAKGLEDISLTLRDRLAEAVNGLQLVGTVAEQTPYPDTASFAADMERMARDVFEMMDTHRVQIMVLDRCVPELPTLAGDWYGQGRYALVDLWSQHLGHHRAYLDPEIDPEALARTIVELIALWAVKMPWDPAPRAYPADMAHTCAVMVRNLATGAPTP